MKVQIEDLETVDTIWWNIIKYYKYGGDHT
jgi:hypothetical protein